MLWRGKSIKSARNRTCCHCSTADVVLLICVWSLFDLCCCFFLLWMSYSYYYHHYHQFFYLWHGWHDDKLVINSTWRVDNQSLLIFFCSCFPPCMIVPRGESMDYWKNIKTMWRERKIIIEKKYGMHAMIDELLPCMFESTDRFYRALCFDFTIIKLSLTMHFVCLLLFFCIYVCRTIFNCCVKKHRFATQMSFTSPWNMQRPKMACMLLIIVGEEGKMRTLRSSLGSLGKQTCSISN